MASINSRCVRTTWPQSVLKSSPWNHRTALHSIGICLAPQLSLRPPITCSDAFMRRKLAFLTFTEYSFKVRSFLTSFFSRAVVVVLFYQTPSPAPWGTPEYSWVSPPPDRPLPLPLVTFLLGRFFLSWITAKNLPASSSTRPHWWSPSRRRTSETGVIEVEFNFATVLPHFPLRCIFVPPPFPSARAYSEDTELYLWQPNFVSLLVLKGVLAGTTWWSESS